jgi:hypothetical protein
MPECPIWWLATWGFGHVFIEIHSNQGVCPRRERDSFPLVIKEPKKRENVKDRFRECCFESLRQGGSQCGHKIGEYGLLCLITRAEG